MEKNFLPKEIKEEIDDYKKFAFNQNMIMVALGLIMANAFQKCVTAISQYLVMPIVNYFITGVDGDWRLWVFLPVKGMSIEIGNLAGAIIDFLILTGVLYVIYAKILKKIWPDSKIYEKKI